MPLLFTTPNPLNGWNLKSEIESVGYHNVELDIEGDGSLSVGGRRNSDNLPVDESDRVAIQSAVTAHTGQPTQEQQEQAQAEDVGSYTALRSKARAVWRGEDTFTAAQVQKLLAGIVLRWTRPQ